MRERKCSELVLACRRRDDDGDKKEEEEEEEIVLPLSPFGYVFRGHGPLCCHVASRIAEKSRTTVERAEVAVVSARVT